MSDVVTELFANLSIKLLWFLDSDWPTAKCIIGCERSRGAHSGEPLTRANRTIRRPLVVTSCTSGQLHVTHATSRALGADPGEPLECYWNVPGADRVDPGQLIERTHNKQCQVLNAVRTLTHLAEIFLGNIAGPFQMFHRTSPFPRK